MKRSKSDPTQIQILLAEKEAKWKYQKIVEKALKKEGLKIDDINIVSLIELAEQGNEVELEFSGKVVVNEDLTTTEKEDQTREKPKRKIVYYQLDLKKQGEQMRYKLEEIDKELFLSKKGVFIKHEE